MIVINITYSDGVYLFNINFFKSVTVYLYRVHELYLYSGRFTYSGVKHTNSKRNRFCPSVKERTIIYV